MSSRERSPPCIASSITIQQPQPSSDEIQVPVFYKPLFASPLTFFSQPNGISVPRELVTHIINAVPDGAQELLNVALMSKMWLPLCREKTRTTIVLDHSNYAYFQRQVPHFSTRFTQTVRTIACHGFAPSSLPLNESPLQPIIAEVVEFLDRFRNVTHLKFSDIICWVMRNEITFQPNVNPSWQRLTVVTTLSLTRVVVLHMIELVGILSAMPVLTALELDCVDWHVSHDMTTIHVCAVGEPPHIQRLRVAGVMNAAAEQFASWYQRHPNAMTALANVQVEMSLDHHPLHPVVDVFGPSIEYLKIRLRTPHRKHPPAPLTHFPTLTF